LRAGAGCLSGRDQRTSDHNEIHGINIMNIIDAIKAINIRHLDKLFIDGAWVAPSSDGKIDIVSPMTEEVILQVAEAREADMDRAVAAARKAFDEGPWPRRRVQLVERPCLLPTARAHGKMDLADITKRFRPRIA